MNNFGTIEKYNKQDYFAGEIDLSLVKTNTNNYFKNKIAYNQKNLGNNYICTIIAGIGILSNYFDKVYTKEEIFNIVDLARKQNPPFRDGVGWRLYKAVDLNRQVWNKANPDNEITTFRVDTFGQLFMDYLDKGYHIQTGFTVNREYWQDKKDDCSIDNSVKGVGQGGIGHSIYLGKNNGKLYVIDSYKGAGCNQYSLDLPIEDLAKFFFRDSYIFIPKKDIMTQLEKDTQSVELALKLGITNNQQNLVNIKKGNYTQDVKTILFVMRAYNLLKG